MQQAATGKLLSALTLSIGLAIAGCGEHGANAGKDQAQASQHIERAQSYLQQGQYRAAIIEARNATKLAANDSRGLLLEAQALNQLGQSKQTIKLLETKVDNADAATVGALAEAYIAQRKYQSALDLLNTQSTRLHTGNSAEWQLLIARARAGSGDFRVAQASLQNLAANPQYATRAKLELARNAFAQGDKTQGYALCEEILHGSPQDVQTLLLLARQSELDGHLDRAEDLLSRALIVLPQTDVITPTKIETLETLISVLTKLGRSSEALVYSKALADADPKRMQLQDKLGKGLELFQAGKFDEAQPLLEEVYKQSENNTAGMLLGMIRYARNDMAGAAAYLGAHVDPEVAPDEALLALATTELRSAQPQKLLDLITPEQRVKLKNPQLKTLVGIALLETGKTAEGEQLIAQARAEQTDTRAITILMAQHYLADQQPQRAQSLLQAELSRYPQDVDLSRLLISAHLNAGAPDQALRLAQTLAARQPPDAANYAVLGRIALQTRQYDVSATALQKALALNPKLTVAEFDLAQLQLLQQQPAAAEASFQKILQRDADNVAALKGLITAHEMARGRNATDIEQLLLGGAAKPSSNRRAVMAEYYLRNKRLDDAERLLAATASDGQDQLYPNQVRQQLAAERASTALAGGDATAARSALLHGLQIEPGNAQLMAQLARLELRSGNASEAGKIVQQLQQLQPSSALVAELQGDIAAAAGKQSEALAHYKEAWQRDPDNAVGAKLHALLQRGDAAAAAKFLQQWQSAQPGNATPLLLQGVALEKQGDKAGAVRAYEAGLARNANHAGLLNNLALLYLQLGDARAAGLGERAYRLQPQNPAVLDSYGWILVKSGDAGKGLELLQQAKALAPNSPEIDAHLKAAQAR